MVDFPGKEKYDLADYRRLVALLRGEGGCPWDREQTHQSIRRNMLEEAYEAVGAIDENDPAHLREELGDVLLQVLLHADMAEEDGWFDLDDVADTSVRKLIFRHPHVFGDVSVRDSDEVLRNWDALKKVEKSQKTLAETLEGVTCALPALTRAEKCQKRLEQAGRPIVLPLPELPAGADAAESIGELLWSVVALSRSLGVDAEAALHDRCRRLIRETRRQEL